MQHGKSTLSGIISSGKAAEPRRPVGIYVSSAAEGHRRRAIAIAKQAPDCFTLLGSGLKGKSDTLAIVDLPAESSRGGAGRAESRRLSRIAAWIDCAKPALILIDSCVKVAALAREKNVPTAYMRLAGNRSDAAHLQAFAAARAVLCPFHALLEADTTPQWLKNRSRYFPGLTENNSCSAGVLRQTAENPAAPPVMLIVAGHVCRGKKRLAASNARLNAAAAALPGWRLEVVGRACPLEAQARGAPNLRFHGEDGLDALIRKAALVAGPATDCLLAAVAAAGKPFICMPQRHPHDEQTQKAERLAELRAAAVCRRWPRNWAKTVQKTMRRGAVLAALHEDDAAARAAGLLLDLAHGAAPAGTGIFAAAAPQSEQTPRQPFAAPLMLSGRKRGIALRQKSGSKTARPRRAA